MLVRSLSTPLSTPLVFHSPELSPSIDSASPIGRTRSICFSSSSSLIERSCSLVAKASYESNLTKYVIQKKQFDTKNSRISLDRLFSNEYSGGRTSGGGNGGSGSNHGDKNSWFFGSNGVEEYYLRTIEENPGNSLFLGNYARFLKEVRGDHRKAEEYCSRAILTNPNDGRLLAFYAELIWEGEKDSSRVDSYYHRAIQAAPDDSRVLGSYAQFLWDTEEEDGERVRNRRRSPSSVPCKYFGAGSSSPYPIAAFS